MYSRPVADSIERLRAVWIAAHETTSGKTRPTSRRSQTNWAQGPLSGENGPPPLPAPRSIEQAEQDDLGDDEPEQDPAEEDQRRFGQLGRHEVPVAQDHRHEDAAGGGRQEQVLAEGRTDRSERPPPPQARAPKASAATPGGQAGDGQDRARAGAMDDRVGQGQDREDDQGVVAPGASRQGRSRPSNRARGGLDQGPVAEVGEQPEARGAQAR